MIATFSIMDLDSLHESGRFYTRSYNVRVNGLHVHVDVLDNTIKSKNFPELQAPEKDRVVESFDLYGGLKTGSGRCKWFDDNHKQLREALYLFERTIQGMMPGVSGEEWQEELSCLERSAS